MLYNGGVKVTINGKAEDVPDGATVAELVERLGLGGSACAVEVNRALVPKREHEGTRLKERDEVEVVTLVGGG